MRRTRAVGLAGIALFFASVAAIAEPIRIVALGASVTNGKGVDRNTAFPAQMERLLRAEGYDVQVTNAGVDDDTPAGMFSRLSRDVPDGTNIVIYQPGSNDRYSGKEGAARILSALRERHIEVLVYPSSMLDQQGRTVAQEYGAVFIGRALMDKMGGSRNGGLDKRHYLDGTHFTPEGHRLAAEAIAQEVKKLIAARPASAGHQGVTRQLDLDGDGMVTIEEFIEWRRQKFESMDANRDGVLSREEFETGIPVQMPPPARHRLFARSDPNSDARITIEEFDTASREIFRAADRAGAGRLNVEEITALRSAVLLGSPTGNEPAPGGAMTRPGEMPSGQMHPGRRQKP